MNTKYMIIKETAKKWGISERWIRKLCSEGRISGAIQFGRVWAIPFDAEKPMDMRLKNGKYVGWRKKNQLF